MIRKAGVDQMTVMDGDLFCLKARIESLIITNLFLRNLLVNAEQIAFRF